MVEVPYLLNLIDTAEIKLEFTSCLLRCIIYHIRRNKFHVKMFARNLPRSGQPMALATLQVYSLLPLSPSPPTETMLHGPCYNVHNYHLAKLIHFKGKKSIGRHQGNFSC